jgi:hypothetical protein
MRCGEDSRPIRCRKSLEELEFVTQTETESSCVAVGAPGRLSPF